MPSSVMIFALAWSASFLYQGVGEQNQALDRGERLEKAATNNKDEAIANESCIGRRTTEHKSRLSRRKRGRGTAR